MRIAEVSAFSQYSVGKIMRDIKNFIDKNTDDVCEIFYARGDGPQEKGFNKFGKNAEVYLNAARARIFDDDGFGFKGNTHRLIKQLEAFKPDIIHIHCLHGYYINVELFFKFLKESGVKVIWTMHDAWAFTGHCCYFSMVDCEKWRNQCCRCPQKNEYPSSIVFDCSYRNYQKKKEIFTSLPVEQLKIITPSNWLSNLVKESFLKKYSVETVHNGINTDIFNMVESKEFISIPKNKKILLGVASVWDKRKGLDTFLNLSKVLSDDWHIILIGRIDKKITFPLNVTHINRTNNQEVLKAYYQKASLFLNPTLDENFPTVNLEAQACGCKVLSFNTGGCGETNFGNLFLTKSNDVEKLRLELEECLGKDFLAIDNEKISLLAMASGYYKSFSRW